MRLGQPMYLGAPRRSQLGLAANIVVSLIQGAVAVTLATVQLIYQEYAEQRARKQWERDQASRAAELERQAIELERRNKELSDYLDEITGNPQPGGQISPSAAVSSLLGHPYVPYIVVGGIAAAVLLTRRNANA
jgi:hypothetical protein